MRIRLSVLLFLILFVAAAPAQQKKKRVAVLDFEYGTVHDTISALFGTDYDVGRGICDLVVEKLVSDGEYSVIERKALDAVLAEQNFSNSDRANPATAAKIGKIMGVDAIITGSITQFGRDDKSMKVGGGAFSHWGGRFGVGGFGKKKAKAVVALTARMIDTSTAEILAVAHGKGESERKGVSLLGAGGGGGSGGGGGIDMSNSNFAATILGEAVYQAVDQLAKELDTQAGKLPTRQVKIDGLVADSTDGVLILNIGSNAGVKVGDRYAIKRPVREVKDPATGRVLRTITQQIGEVVITEVEEGSSVGNFTGASTCKVGDIVTNH